MLDPSLLHLNHGSFGAVPRVTREYQQALHNEMEASPVRWFLTVYGRLAAARRQIAVFLGTDPKYLALIPNASAGATVVMNALHMRPGDNVIVTDHGYGAVVMGVKRHAAAHGATVTTVHIPLDADGGGAVARIRDAITDRTVAVVVDQISSATATLFPVADIVRAAHAEGVPVLVDGAHAPGLIAGDPASIGADWWIGNLHKFACAPRGSAVLVVRPDVAGELHPLIDSWNPAGPFPERFDVQGTLDYTGFLAAPRSFEYIADEFGWDAARDYMEQLVEYGQWVIADAFGRATGEDHMVRLKSPPPAMRLIRLPGCLGRDRDSADALRLPILERCGAECAFTSFDGIGYIRISAHVYNTASDFERFAQICVPVLLTM